MVCDNRGTQLLGVAHLVCSNSSARLKQVIRKLMTAINSLKVSITKLFVGD